jgi:protein TonB
MLAGFPLDALAVHTAEVVGRGVPPNRLRNSAIQPMTATLDPLAPWQPDELGMPRATAAAALLVAFVIAFCYWASVILAPKPKPPVIQVTQAQLVQLPAPTPPPPKIIPPKPVPAVIPKPPPVASKIVVATKPPPPIHPVAKPVHRIIPRHEAPPIPQSHPVPSQPAPVHAAPAPQASQAPPTSGIPIYGEHMHAVLEENQSVPPALAQLGVAGVALIRITVSPSGKVLSAAIVRSSGVALIDQTALAHVREASFGAFNSEMPSTPQSFVIPVDIQPQAEGASDSGD